MKNFNLFGLRWASDKLKSKISVNLSKKPTAAPKVNAAASSSREDMDRSVDIAFRLARKERAPKRENLPVDFQLRKSGILRRLYENALPVSHVMRLNFRFGRDFLDDFMPLGIEDYIGRGSYKFVYRLPWRMVLKVSKEVLPSDPLFGSLFRRAHSEQEKYLTSEEIALQEFLFKKSNRFEQRRIRFKFDRLAMERLHYWKVRDGIPDLVLPTKFFMGIRYREKLWGRGFYEKVTPMDSQIMLEGKHLKELAHAVKKENGRFNQRFFPKYSFQFDTVHFQSVKRKTLLKIIEDFHRLIQFTQKLAREEKLILDIHSENIIITLPDFELKIFDFHLFDENLYERSMDRDRPESEHIVLIEKFIESISD